MTPIFPGPAYRVVTPRLILRCWDPADAPAIQEAITASLEHLRPWMPWALQEPKGLEAQIQQFRAFRSKFDSGQDYVYGIFERGSGLVLGGSGLHTRAGTDAREIGYWIRAGYTRRGYASEASAALTRVAFEIDGVHRVEIHMNPANTPSASVPPKLGYHLDAVLRKRTRESNGELADRMVWSMLAEEYPGSPCAKVEIEAFDAAGRKIL